MKNIILFLPLLALSSLINACEVDLSDFDGYKIIYSGKVTGYIDEDGKRGDDFEGCDFGRVLIIDYLRQVTCQTFQFSYAFMPEIVVLSDGYSMKACVKDRIYNVTR